METINICSQCKLNEQYICLSCVQKQKNALRLQLPELRQQYAILEKKLQPANWDKSFTLYKHWRDVFVVKCQQEKHKILDLHARIKYLKDYKRYRILDSPAQPAIDKSNNLVKVKEFKQKQALELQLKLQKQIYLSLDAYSSFRNDTPYAYILGSIPSPVQITVFQLPIEDLLGIVGHAALILKVFERINSTQLQFDYVLRNSHSRVFIHKNLTALSFVKHKYEYHLFLPEVVLQFKGTEKQDDNIDTGYMHSFIVALTLLIYDISCLYDVANLGDFISNPFRYLLQTPNPKRTENFKILDIAKSVLEEMLKVPYFNGLLDHLIKSSGYGLINDHSSESSNQSMEDFTILHVATDKQPVIAEIWEDLKYHLRLLDPPFDVLDK